jgi:preprotein translocase subunit SecA
MHKIDEALYFVIEEKNNQVELTDNGIKYLLDTDSDFLSFQTLELKLQLKEKN